MFCEFEGVLEVDVGTTDTFINLTNSQTQLLNKGVPWRGGREKDSKSLQVFVQALSKPRDVVIDAYASTYAYGLQCQPFKVDCSLSISMSILSLGASIHACKQSGCHIVALEGDSAIFKCHFLSIACKDPSPHMWKCTSYYISRG